MKDPESFGNTAHVAGGVLQGRKTYFSGGAGLASTASDYARFAQMLLNGGALDGVRLLSPKTIELMTASHTADLTPPLPICSARASDFGLGFRVVTDLAATQTLGSDGMYGWSGIYGTNFWVDPKEKLVADHDGAEVSGLDGRRRVPAARVSGADPIKIAGQVLEAGVDRDGRDRPCPGPARAPASSAAATFRPLDVPAKIPSSLAARRAIARPSSSSIARASS